MIQEMCRYLNVKLGERPAILKNSITSPENGRNKNEINEKSADKDFY